MNALEGLDTIVIGGGPSGVAAAIMSARGGARTLLLERYGRLGGMAVNALVSPFMGESSSVFMKEFVAKLGGNAVDAAECDVKMAEALMAEGARIRLHTWAFKALMDGSRVKGVRALSKDGETDIEAKVVVDASGDGDVAFSAGAPYEKGRDGDGLLQPMSVMFRLGGVDKSKALLCGSEEEAKRVKVPEGTWEEVVLKGHESGELPSNIGVVRIYESARDARTVNATQVNYVDGTKAEDLTRAEIEGRSQAFKVLAFLKRHAPGYESAHIAEMPAVIGVRETRRFLGVEYLTKADLVSGRRRPDAVVSDAEFCIDIHNPDGGGQAKGVAERVKPYDIPYGCLVPRETDGLLLAGRCISGSHEAHASYRIMRIAFSTGAAAGAAAALCAKSGRQPRQLDVKAIRRALAMDRKD